MITSNINTTLLRSKIENEIDNNISKSPFIDSLLDNKTKTIDTSLEYENIKNLSYEDIETLFENEEEKQNVKNLKLATMFTDDKYLGKALFNTVKGEPFSVSSMYLFDMYEDKNSYFNSFDSNNSLSDLLHESVSQKLSNSNSSTTDVIPQEYLDKVLLEVNSFNFISALSNTSKDSYDRYKDEDNDYSFLYNDYYLKYQELIEKYENEKLKEKSLLEQFR